METNEGIGIRLFILGVALIVFIALTAPNNMIVASGPAAFLFAFGGMLASGKWPYQPKRRKKQDKRFKR